MKDKKTVSNRIVDVLKTACNDLNSENLGYFSHYLGGFLSTRLQDKDLDLIERQLRSLVNQLE